MRSKAPAALLLASLLAAACSGGSSSTKASSTPTPSVTPTPSTTPSTAPTVALTDWLTGLTLRRTGPVVGVKVDNAVLARPYQRGLKQAAIVYQELVEGGSTRFLAILESDVASNFEVGPIRSVRESDVDLLREYLGIDVAFSGGNTGVKAIFASAARKGQVINASYDAVPGAYRLGERRRDARNFFATADSLTKKHPGKGPVDIGLRFSAALPGIGVLTPVAAATFSPDSVLRIRYDVASKAFVLSEGGNVIPVSPANVLVQYVHTKQSRFSDVHGEPTPFTVSTGKGKAVLMRGGRRFTGTWSRTGFGATHFLTSTGKQLTLAPGSTWVVLLPQQGSLSF